MTILNGWESHLKGAGGLVIMWSKVVFEILDCFDSGHYVGVVRRWGKIKKMVTLISVHAPCDLRDKKNLWKELLSLKMERGGTASVSWGTSILYYLITRGKGWKSMEGGGDGGICIVYNRGRVD